MTVNALLKEIKFDDITVANRLIRACAIFVGKNQASNQTKKEEMQWQNPSGKEEYSSQYKSYRNILAP